MIRKLLWLIPVVAVTMMLLVLQLREDTAPPSHSDTLHWQPMENPGALMQWHYDIRTAEGDEGPRYELGYRIKEIEKARALRKSGGQVLDWIERGPGNVAGRTRGLIIDPNDESLQTWFAGSVGGGIWKTTSAGAAWELLTPEFSNLATSTLGMSPANPDVIYAGTGEGFGNLDAIAGDGMWKSIDHGETWAQLDFTAGNNDFRFVNRLIVDPADENTVVAVTNSGILRSTNGGESFTKVWEFTGTQGSGSQGLVQHVVFHPDNFNVQYAGVNQFGVLKSTDAGQTWTRALDTTTEGQRVELAVSLSDPSVVYAALQNQPSQLFVSQDAGASWSRVTDLGQEPNWMGNQGWYDNSIAVDPFDPDRVFVGGINVWRIDLQEGTSEERGLTSFDAGQTESFLDFVNFTDAVVPGLGLGPETDGVNITEDELVSVEIRFGPGRSQKAHRFTVPAGATSGVPPSDYAYQDYVDVPFEVWDITNDRQLMVSFRDQQADGAFQLIGDTEQGREYIFVNLIPYDDNAPDPSVSVQAGHTERMAYFVWAIAEGQWDPPSHPDSRIQILYETRVVRQSQSTQLTTGSGLHVDHHNLKVYDVDQDAQTFRILNANDGGVGRSFDSGNTWLMTIGGYNTTQFYGADKKPGENKYVGGTQDNGTYLSIGDSPTNTSPWTLVWGGDGFETIWNSSNPDLILVSSQFNTIGRSSDGGGVFQPAINGLTDSGQGNAPFLVKLAKSRIDPDLVFTVGTSGVWRSDDFGLNWELTPIPEDRWNIGNFGLIESSKANPQVVWAGAWVSNSAPGRLNLSTDGGLSFEPVDVLDNNVGRISGLGSHPFDPNTAYVLFSAQGIPKVLRTTDLGETWEDISGFDTGGKTSDNGFPDVAVYDILVLPHDTDQIWAGTEIGLFISEDGGTSWSFADGTLPAVSIWQLRVVDDQVIAATHGRGVWTVTIPELAAIALPNVPQAPRLDEAFYSVTGSITTEVDLRSSFDSTQVLVNGDRLGSIGATAAADTLIQIPFSAGESIVDVQIAAFRNGDVFKSPVRKVETFSVPQRQFFYTQEFSSLSAIRDFRGDGFSVQRQNGWLGTTSPYPNDTELTLTLVFPIVVSEVISTMSWKDVALVQPGLPGFDYTQPGFRDYVIVEASTNGVNWTPLVDGYDASFDVRWLGLWQNGPAAASLYRTHEVDLRDFYTAGQQIFIRFRLFSNQDSVTGWGWVIDDLEIQPGAPVASEDLGDLPETFALHANYPNPFNPSTTIAFSLPEATETSIEVFDLNGRLVERLVSRQYPAGNHSVTWDARNVASGTYLYRLSAGDFVQSRKMLLMK